MIFRITCDPEADQGIGDAKPECDRERAQDDTERDEAVDARMVPVRDERRAVEPPSGTQAHARGDLVAGKAERAREPDRQEVVDVLRVDEPHHGRIAATQAETKIARMTANPQAVRP